MHVCNILIELVISIPISVQASIQTSKSLTADWAFSSSISVRVSSVNSS